MGLNITKGSITNYTNGTITPTDPHAGDMWYDPTASTLKVYSGSTWTATEADGTKKVVLENRTSDPTSPEVGQIWIRTDL